jgi:hypothetical protein
VETIGSIREVLGWLLAAGYTNGLQKDGRDEEIEGFM